MQCVMLKCSPSPSPLSPIQRKKGKLNRLYMKNMKSSNEHVWVSAQNYRNEAKKPQHEQKNIKEFWFSQRLFRSHPFLVFRIITSTWIQTILTKTRAEQYLVYYLLVSHPFPPPAITHRFDRHRISTANYLLSHSRRALLSDLRIIYFPAYQSKCIYVIKLFTH